MTKEEDLLRRKLELDGMKHKILRIQYALKSKEAAYSKLGGK